MALVGRLAGSGDAAIAADHWRVAPHAADLRSHRERFAPRREQVCDAVRRVDVQDIAQRSAAVTLLGIAGLHAAWAAGRSWPAGDRGELADLMAGPAGGAVPSPPACLTVATLLTGASALVSGRPQRLPKLRRAGTALVAGVLSGRGACGMVGRTDLVSPNSTSPRFRRLDRRYDSPLCLALALAAASSARR